VEGYDIRSVQELLGHKLLGHKGVGASMIYARVSRGGRAVRGLANA
jgi:site-specific recombinase XerD